MDSHLTGASSVHPAPEPPSHQIPTYPSASSTILNSRSNNRDEDNQNHIHDKNIEFSHQDRTSISSSSSSSPTQQQQQQQQASSATTLLPTAHELATLRHIPSPLPLRVWLVAFIAALERFAYWSTQVTWQNYMQYPPSSSSPVHGVLGLGQSTASLLLSAFNALIYLLPLALAPVADGWLGRYRTLQVCSAVYLCGMTVLTATSTEAAVDAGAALPGFLVALGLCAVGLAGVQTVTMPLIADQYCTEGDVVGWVERKGGGECWRRLAGWVRGGKGKGSEGKGTIEEKSDEGMGEGTREKVILDRDMTIHYIYSVYYFMTNAACLGMLATTTMEKYLSFWSAYALTTCVLALSVLLLWLGKPYFVLNAPSGTVLPHAFRILWTASTSHFSLDAALPSTQLERHGRPVPWDASFVRDIRRGLKAVKVLLVYPAVHLCAGIATSATIAQASQMETRGFPNDLLMLSNAIALVVLGVAVEKLLYPFLERHYRHWSSSSSSSSSSSCCRLRVAFLGFRPLRGAMSRIALGLGLCALTMAYFALVQGLVYAAPPCYRFPLHCMEEEGAAGPNHVSVWVQIPGYVLFAGAEVFAFVTGSAYAYRQAPASMRSVLQSFNAFMAGVGYLLAMAVSPLARNPYLVGLWAGAAGMMAVVAAGFWVCFRGYDREEEGKEEDGRDTGEGGSSEGEKVDV